MQTLWKSGTNKAFRGSVAQLIIGLVSGLLGGAAVVTGMFGLVLVVALANIAAYVYFIMGITEMKKAAVGSTLEAATQRLYIAIIVAVVGVLIGLIPGGKFIAWIPSLASYILFWTGYAMIKNTAVDANAKLGGQKLCSAALLSLIGVVIALIPIVGTIVTFVLSIVAIVFTIQGWKALAQSNLE